ncbi:MAG: adenosylcobinamide-phosphate synthase CbiB [Cyanobacteria bacterium P01_F01_bin.42]
MWQSCLAVVGAAMLDFLVGDPWSWPHPVQLMGWVISQYSKLVLQHCPSQLGQKALGIILTGMMTLGSGAIAWLILYISGQWFFPLKIILEVIMLASCFAGRSLRRAAEDVLGPLEAGDLVEARSRLSRYVGRDTESLDRAEVLRAVMETVSENAVDGVTAPLFYALVGLALPTGPVPLAIAYKAASTLDSMVGYRRAPYTNLGWCSAKVDDLLTWLPCRLTVLSLSILSRRPKTVWKLCWRDAPKDPSPNSGWSECAYAASVGVRLGGLNMYQGQSQQKPFVGDSLRPITPQVISQALRLTRSCFMLWIVIALSVFAAVHYG